MAPFSTAWMKTAFVCLSLVSGSALADAPPPECKCRTPDGELRNLGTELCMTISGQPARMRCEMSTNTPFWKPLDTAGGCAPA